ncbi:MAG: methyltransferase domain-containing protein [Nocardioidaceae bacterium]
MALWDPATYLQFADERSRPFFELTQRVGATAPHRVVDLGCGPGQLTATLAARWPSAEVVGLDSSPEMVERARAHATEQLSFRVADLVDWAVVPDGEGDEAPDVLVANAALQWVPEHRALLPALVRRLAPDGWLAFQVPGNFAQPSHLLLHELAAEPRFAGATQSVERPDAFGADVYIADLAAAGLAVEAWETTYLHVLTGEDPVFAWISGTGARPVLESLDGEQREAFVAEYKALLRAAYPPRPFGTVLPFRRVFVVAHREAS